MKRIIAILLTVLLLGMLTACDQNVGRHADGIIKADKATFEIGKTHSSFEGMNIQIANAIWDDEEIKLDVNWINKTGYDVVYGSSYDIERENNGEWSSCVTLEDCSCYSRAANEATTKSDFCSSSFFYTPLKSQKSSVGWFLFQVWNTCFCQRLVLLKAGTVCHRTLHMFCPMVFLVQ